MTEGDETGAAISVCNFVIGIMKGMQIGGANLAGNMKGMQLNAMFGFVKKDFKGVQLAGMVNKDWNMEGVQISGLVNIVDGDKMAGLQIAILGNKAMTTESSGVQFGFINQATSMKGIQIGLINIIEDGPLYFCPIINAAF